MPTTPETTAKRRIPLDPKESRKRKRERLAIVLFSILFIALTIFEFKLTKVSTTLPLVNSIFFFGLLNINIILLVGVIWLIARNIGKLFFERRNKVLGSRLKTKLVVAFSLFSITPTLVLFAISSLYINSSFDKWFSLRIQNTLEGSLEITRTYYQNAEETATHFAQHIADQLGSRLSMPDPLDPVSSQASEPPRWLHRYLESQVKLLALNAVEFYSDPFEERVVAQREMGGEELPRHYPRLSLDLLEKAFSGNVHSVIQQVGSGDLIRTILPVYASGKNDLVGVLSVSSYIPVSLVNKVDEIASVFGDYKGTNPLKYPIKTAYFVILVMITLVIIFVAIWLGLYLARELTVPVEKLVKGAQAVGSGDLDVNIEGTGQDEIGVLVDAFNGMTHALKENRAQLTQASKDLETRSLQLEAVLANVGTGVIVVDRSGEVMTFNRAASQLLETKPRSVLGKHFREVFQKEIEPIQELVRKSLEQTEAEPAPEIAQMNIRIGEKTKSLAGIASPLKESGVRWGVVVVIDDMTHLVKAQREVAWREVARRIAHEIKNPLTPIKLSAQRLQRRLGRTKGYEGELLRECTDTIVKHTDELKEMVNEFSNFARLPQVTLVPNDLNEAIQEVVALFSQAHPSVIFDAKLEKRVPIFEFDRDQIKRVIMNLLDNAVNVVESTTRPKIDIATYYNDQLQMAVIAVGDNGPGMSKEVVSRVFEPYFSTKEGGTGLGLAIAKRIINDHDGFIRVQSDSPVDSVRSSGAVSSEGGTRFWIELPTAKKQRLQTDSRSSPEAVV